MTDGDGPGGYVPVEASALEALARRTTEVQAAARATREALDGLAELAADYRSDAVRRLQERGASEAQVARYQDSLDAALRTVRTRLDALDAACTALGTEAPR